MYQRSNPRTFIPLFFLCLVAACWATVPYQTLPPAPDSDTSDDDDADDDDVSLPDDDDGSAWDDLCHAAEVADDWDCDGIEDGYDGILLVDDQFWVHVDLMGNLDLDDAYLVGHGLEVAENDPSVDTDWAQREFKLDCTQQADWCRVPVEDVPPRNDLRLSISDGTATALLDIPEPEVFDHWASFGPDYCTDTPDPICWDNSDYEGPSTSLCLEKQIVDGNIYLSPSSNCGVHTYEEAS